MFKKTVNGQRDPNINSEGRPKEDKLLSNRAIKQRELLSLLRKVKPHLAVSLSTAVNMMGDKIDNRDVAHTTRLKAAIHVLDVYRDLMTELYGTEVDSDEEGEEIQPQAGATVSFIYDKDKAA